jgi:hypothetical protein
MHRVSRDWSAPPRRDRAWHFPGDSFIATLSPTGCRQNSALTLRSEGGSPDGTSGEVRRAFRTIAPVRFPLSDRCSPFDPVGVGTGNRESGEAACLAELVRRRVLRHLSACRLPWQSASGREWQGFRPFSRRSSMGTGKAPVFLPPLREFLVNDCGKPCGKQGVSASEKWNGARRSLPIAGAGQPVGWGGRAGMVPSGEGGGGSGRAENAFCCGNSAAHKLLSSEFPATGRTIPRLLRSHPNAAFLLSAQSGP